MEAIAALILANLPTIGSALVTAIVGIYAGISKVQAAQAKAITAQTYADMVTKYAQAAVAYIAEKNALLVKTGQPKITSQDKLTLATDFLLAQCKMQGITISSDSAVQMIKAMLAMTTGEGSTGDNTIISGGN